MAKVGCWRCFGVYESKGFVTILQIFVLLLWQKGKSAKMVYFSAICLVANCC